MEVVLGLAAALLFSLGTVLQQLEAARASEDEARRAGFLLRLARRPRWLAGIAADGLGFAAQATALAIGRLVVVQPLLATSVVFSLPLGVKLEGRQIGRTQWVAAAAVTLGLAGFLIVADPSGGRDDATTVGWIASFATFGGVSVALLVAAHRRSPVHRAALLGSAAGILFGLTAALTKATVEELDDGVLAVLGDWHLYALVAVGYAATMLTQASLQAGPLAPAVATQSSLNPIASLLMGTLVFDETIHESAAGLVAALAAFAVMLVGLVVLSVFAAPSMAAPGGGGAAGERRGG
jgi:drug/metabolite transporter (DMT)-like permease